MARRTLRNLDERILNRAIYYGAEKGISNVSTKKIAFDLKITEPTIYVHFKTKNNLLKEAFKKASKTAFLVVESEDMSTPDKVGEVFKHHFYEVLNQAKAHKLEVIYSFNFRNCPLYEPHYDAFFDPLETIKKAILVAYHHGKNETWSLIDSIVSDLVTKEIDLFINEVVQDRVDLNQTTALFMATLIENGVSGGKQALLSQVDEETANALRSLPPKK